jgi:hypothetical protein
LDAISKFVLNTNLIKADVCSSDPGNPRTLSGASYVDGIYMTEESCVSYCNAKNYTYAGVEFSQECCKYLSEAGMKRASYFRQFSPRIEQNLD